VGNSGDLGKVESHVYMSKMIQVEITSKERILLLQSLQKYIVMRITIYLA